MKAAPNVRRSPWPETAPCKRHVRKPSPPVSPRVLSANVHAVPFRGPSIPSSAASFSDHLTRTSILCAPDWKRNALRRCRRKGGVPSASSIHRAQPSTFPLPVTSNPHRQCHPGRASIILAASSELPDQLSGWPGWVRSMTVCPSTCVESVYNMLALATHPAGNAAPATRQLQPPLSPRPSRPKTIVATRSTRDCIRHAHDQCRPSEPIAKTSRFWGQMRPSMAHLRPFLPRPLRSCQPSPIVIPSRRYPAGPIPRPIR